MGYRICKKLGFFKVVGTDVRKSKEKRGEYVICHHTGL